MKEILNILSVILSIAVIVVTAFLVLPKRQKPRAAHYPTIRKSTLNSPRIEAGDYDKYLVEKYILPSKSK